MAYRAEIQIGVSGIGQLNALQKTLNQLNSNIDRVNAKEIQTYFNIQNINTYNTKLKEAAGLVNKVKMGSPEEVQAIKTLVQAKNNQIAAQERLNKLIEREMLMQQKIVATANAGFGQQGPALPPISAQAKRGPVSPIGGAPNIPGSPAALQAAADAQSKMAENLMLGAGFPLLFGGGVGEVAGGLLGSFVGKGFGGQILGSALGRIFQDLGQAAVDLSKTLQSPASSFDQIKEKSLLSSKAQERYVETLIKNGEIVKANAVIYADFNKRFGETSLTSLRTNSDKLARSMAELGVRMQLVVAGPLEKFIDWVNTRLSTLNIAQASEQLAARLPATKRAEFERESMQIADKQLIRGLNPFTRDKAQKEDVREMLALLDKYEKFVPKKNVPLSVDDLKLQLEAGRALRDVYAENFKLQLEKGLSVKVLNGEILQDYVRINEIQNEYLTTNEKLAVAVKNVKDIEAAGGVAKGIVSAEEMGKLKNEITALENKKLDLKVQANKESLALFEKELKAAGERATRALELQAGAVRGQETIAQSQFTLQKSLNDLYSQRLDMEVQLLEKQLEQTTNLAQQEAIFQRLREINHIRYQVAVSNAKIEQASTYSQIQSGLQLLTIEMRKQEILFKNAQATMFEAKARGALNQDYINAVDAQYDALQLSKQTYDFAVRNADIQTQIADATYRQKLEAAGFARNMELAAINARQTQAAMAGKGAAEFGQGLGQTFQIGRKYTAATQSFSVPAMATGGFVKSPTLTLLAEGGQGEYVIPESKASSFAMNYLMGSRGSAAVPASGSDTASPAATPTVNIQTGPVTQMNGTNYVTTQDMRRAVQAGIEQTLRLVSRDARIRSSVGIR